MKSYNDWQNNQQFVEFVGPAGQVDPQGPMSPVTSSPTEEMPMMLQKFITLLQNKPAQQIMDAQQKFNGAISQLLQTKSNSVGKTGVANMFNNAQQAKMNYGRPAV